MVVNTRPIIIKRYEIIEGGGHHGGGWKVAYADFMTAMMAFFLLMWILASADEDKLRGVAEYFTDATMPGGIGVLDGATLGPPGTLAASNGSVVARGSELGKIDDPATDKIDDPATDKGEDPATDKGNEFKMASGNSSVDASTRSSESGSDADQALDDMKFKQLQNDILQAMQDNPDLDPLKQNVIFEQTTEGLHIQIIDQQGKPMFHTGRAELVSASNALLSNLGTSLAALMNPLVLSGHTDAIPFADSAKYDNWDLSSDRANAIRRVFETSGVSHDRIIRVSGMADTQLLVPEKPSDPSNRRISIMVKYRGSVLTTPKPKSVNEAPSKRLDTSTPKVKTLGNDAPVKESLAAAGVASNTSVLLDDQVFLNLRSALR